MSVKIRFARAGTRNAPYFRIVAMDSRKKRDGAYLDYLGTYNPANGDLAQFHPDRFLSWIAQGAVISDGVNRVYKKYQAAQQK